ncbi:hypothetical protein LA354_22485 [Ralstonia pickettii]|nr:hypothetical protein LA354_22485 [Ralstonia pickettii]
MHPRSVRTHPGSCPKCGMALEPAMPSLEADENPELAAFRRRFWWTLPLTIAVVALVMLGGVSREWLRRARLGRACLVHARGLVGRLPIYADACSRSATAARTCGR